ncbi:glycosyl transferase [Pseudomonas sp. Leaf48]|jgi:glycosyltransferase involved in cell wall biosynthesis|uniref:glycosyltransferase n=1 Tax=Pseudomonas sp. Leaf48 TaxID=1736221 RepID=UPI0007295910|nr:glycosyltransferase family 2 protein [Pseudomonas sp. Leaf48]KQN48724.1 glycosyl transferase [Pseudomonas sp. Leaf48]
MIGVIVPVHNEEAFLDDCIESLLVAALHEGLGNEEVQVLLVLDACTDNSLQIAQAYGVRTLTCNHRNVGQSRAHGAEHLLAAGARWLAFTDADSIVPRSWLADQLKFNVDAVCGLVQVIDWSEHPLAVRERYDAHYRIVEGHRHIHGANLGVSSTAYLDAGGFRALPTHEDVQLIADLERSGANIMWTATNRVITSARKDCRCREGFGDFLQSLAE